MTLSRVALGGLEVRAAGDGDRDAIVDLAVRALGWAGDQRDRDFFAWKHDQNPFGPSPAWVAVEGGEIIGFRTFLRWELACGDERLRMVRAVDTATDPAHQGKGVFKRLTLGAVEELTGQGYDAVFNTPNDQSRPGYLKMGWTQLGCPTLGVAPRSPAALVGMARSRTPAEKWSEPAGVGEPASDVFGAEGFIPPCTVPASGWSTPRTAEFLRWRYSFEPLHYRVVEVRGGLCVFRVRRRGPSREVAICEWLSDRPDPRAVRRLIRAAGGDYAVGLGLSTGRHGTIPVRRLGPIVTWRTLARPEVPVLADVAFGLGDLELF
jgi:GNAT superfamily N-acetyltransferase